MIRKLASLFIVLPLPALAATGPFFSLGNTDFVVLLAFLLFVGVLLYFRVPGLLVGILDKRAASIRAELDEARAVREEAQTILASFERRQAEVKEQAERIVAHAREEATAAAEQSRTDIKTMTARRIKGAEDQIESARAAAIREVRDRAIQVAVAAASDVLGKQMTAERGDELINSSIETVSAKLH